MNNDYLEKALVNDNKERLIEYIKYPTGITSDINRMGCSENWYDPYFAINQTFSLEEIEVMTEEEVHNLFKLALNLAIGLY